MLPKASLSGRCAGGGVRMHDLLGKVKLAGWHDMMQQRLSHV